MAGEVLFTNKVTFGAAAVPLMNPAISFMFDQDRVSAQYEESIINNMGYTKTTPLNPNEKFSAEVGAPVLDQISEGQQIPVMTTGKTNDKGYTIKEFSDKIPVTKLAYDWLMTSKPIQSADSTVKAALAQFAKNIEKLRKGAIKRRNYQALKVWTDGIAGTGTLTPSGQQLFSATQPYKQGLQTAATFRNVLGGAYGTLNDNLTATSLQNALDIQSGELRLFNGDWVQQPEAYRLTTSRPNQTVARSVLNSPKNGRNPYAGTGSNSELRNTFDFDGNRVVLDINPYLGQADNENVTIGTNAYWFLSNVEALREAEALRVINLDDGEADIWEDKNTKTKYTSYYESYDFDHYGAESYIVGSAGSA